MERVYQAIDSLISHGIKHGMLEEADRYYTINRLLERLKLDAYEEREGRAELELEEALGILLDYAASSGILENDSTVYRDLFDTALMDCLMPRPSEVRARFKELYSQSPKAATDYYYDLSRASDYIRTYRVAKDMKWTAQTPYGELIITINLSKPEKDPKAIAAALSMKASSYPKCLLCKENEGYAGRVNHPARNNHRLIPVTINNSQWFLQYSPYVYYNEHCIVFNAEHTPMKIDHAAFDKLLDFIRQFPHYMVGSNADLPIVGGSILTHDHFQGGNFEFPMAVAEIEREVKIKGFEDISAGIVKWPMTVLRIAGEDPARLADAADLVLGNWRAYTDEAAFVFAETDGVPHNTITPIGRMRDGRYELDLVLRNNITTEEHPDGVYHPHKEHHHIKKENIGLIEVMGLAILPARLKTEMAELRDVIAGAAAQETSDIAAANRVVNELRGNERLEKHSDWAHSVMMKHTGDNLTDPQVVEGILRQEIGIVYMSILEQCAVFERSEAGQAQFLKFIDSIR